MRNILNLFVELLHNLKVLECQECGQWEARQLPQVMLATAWEMTGGRAWPPAAPPSWPDVKLYGKA